MNDGDNFDLLIIGAGPAGSFAAERLARGGARVALFDGRPPREPKACGGGVTSKALKAWPHLSDAAGRTVDEVEMFSPEGARVRLKLAQPFAIYSRTALDSHLRERARAAGVAVFAERVSVSFDRTEGGPWRVRERGTGREWGGRVLVAADGANSPVARKLAGALPNSEMEVAFGYRAPLPKSEDAPTVIAFLPGWVGYAWAFPRLDHVSFGIATTQDAFEHRPLDSLLWDFMLGYYAQREDPRAPLWTTASRRGVVATHDGGSNGNGGGAKTRDGGRSDGGSEKLRAEIESRLRGSVERYAARIPGLAPETFDTRRVVGSDWALLGDAAGFTDRITDEGIYYALRSAEIFAEAYLSGDVLSYETHCRSEFVPQLRRSSALRKHFYKEFLGVPFTERMIRFASLHRGIQLTLSELITGNQDYLSLKRVLVRRALWPF